MRLTFMQQSWLLAFTLGLSGMSGAPRVLATQADNTAINFVSDTAGPTSFIHQLNYTVNPVANLTSVRFTIAPRAGSVTRALSANYPSAYLTSRGFLSSNSLTVPVFGLYDSSTNSVTVSFTFTDNSSKSEMRSVTTAAYSDPCGYKNPIIVQSRTTSTSVSYDYMLLKDACSADSPAVMDSDGALRWVGDAGVASFSDAFYDNAFYVGNDTQLLRIELDGAVSVENDYSDIGVTGFHHNIDPGKYGLLLCVDTQTDTESVILEVDKTGSLIKEFNMADIISAAMTAGGDDPSTFVVRSQDWFHNNANTYRRSDDTLIVSSRENFVIAVDYQTSKIKWILGDPTKAWYQYPSLRAFALSVPAPGVTPIGEHSVSITADDKLLLFDNGRNSLHHTPAGANRTYALPRKYALNLTNGTATEVFQYDQHIISDVCSSVYEDAPNNYLIDYAVSGGLGTANPNAELVGLQSDGSKVFDYKYPTHICDEVFNAIPLHFESLSLAPEMATFPGTLRNVSARGTVGTGENVMIAGFIVTGSANKEVIVRGLGPSLAQFGLNPVIADPIISLFQGNQFLMTNDDYVADAELARTGLTPTNPKESAIVTTLNPGVYSVILGNQAGAIGVGLVEVYEITTNGSQLVNVSARGKVESGNNVLIGGFIVGNGSIEVAARAIGPSLSNQGVMNPLADPALGLYNANGALIASNRNWKDSQQTELTSIGLTPSDDKEAALLTILDAGAYSVIVTNDSGTSNGEGIALLEIFNVGQ